MKKSSAIILFLLSSILGFSSEINTEFVDSIVPQYLKIQSALAEDSLDQAKQSAQKLVHSFHHDSHADNPMLHKLMAASKNISDAKKLSDARLAFSILSKRFISLVENTGTNQFNNLHVFKCTMAFEHKGASWIQSSKSTRNPYYGKMMLSCGSIQKSFSN